MENHSYKKFAWMILMSFVIMYAVMFLNVDQPDHIYLSLTRCYMSLLMVTPMALMMILLMGNMYKNRMLNTLIVASSIIVFVTSLVLLRSQIPIGDRQYMKAMIPHHSSAIMTSRHATLADPEVRQLSEKIMKSQEQEIEQMKKMLQRLEGH